MGGGEGSMRFLKRSIGSKRIMRPIDVFIFQVLMIVAAQTWAAQAPPPPPAPPGYGPQVKTLSLVSRPPLDLVQEAMALSGFPEVVAIVRIAHDAEGNPTDVSISQSSGSAVLDRALMDWSRQVRVTPGRSGVGMIPFKLFNDIAPGEGLEDEAGAQSSPGETADIAGDVVTFDDLVLYPPPDEMLVMFLLADTSTAEISADLDHDASGNVKMVRLAKLTPSRRLDEAAGRWLAGVKLPVDRAGTTRIGFRIMNERGGNSPGVLRAYAPRVTQDQLISADLLGSWWSVVEQMRSYRHSVYGFRYRLDLDRKGLVKKATLIEGGISDDVDRSMKNMLMTGALRAPVLGRKHVIIHIFPNYAVRVLDSDVMHSQ